MKAMKAGAARKTPRFKGWVFLAALGAGFFAAVIAAAVVLGVAKTRPAFNEEPTSGKSAPDFELVMYRGAEVLGGEKLKFSSLFGTGKPVVLNFWAGLCPPCRAEMPHFQEVHEKYKGRVLLFGLDVGPFVGLGSREDGQALLRELKVTYPTGTTFDAQVVRAYNVLGMPTTVFITANGKVFRQWTGLLTKQKLEELVEELLKASGRP
jgi:thiol-disulfide isomerase/thioredoxin